MIYITGDTHGMLDRFRSIPFQKWTSADTLIIAGDFGYIFGRDSDADKIRLLSTLPFTIAFVDGNHECFPRIYAYPEEKWNGGRVHRISGNIVHLMRGQVFELEGLRIFTMGGGISIDKSLREPGVSWWPEELPTEAEYAEGLKNLKRYGNEVDIIISHAAPFSAMLWFNNRGILQGIARDERRLNEYLQYVEDHVKYKKHYFGHLHLDTVLWKNQIALLNAVYCVNNGQQLPPHYR